MAKPQVITFTVAELLLSKEPAADVTQSSVATAHPIPEKYKPLYPHAAQARETTLTCSVVGCGYKTEVKAGTVETRPGRGRERHVLDHMSKKMHTMHKDDSDAFLPMADFACGGAICLRPGCGKWFADHTLGYQHIRASRCAKNLPADADLQPCKTYYRQLVLRCGCGKSNFTSEREAANHVLTCPSAGAVIIRSFGDNLRRLKKLAESGGLAVYRPAMRAVHHCTYKGCNFGLDTGGVPADKLDEHQAECEFRNDASRHAAQRRADRAEHRSQRRVNPIHSSSRLSRKSSSDAREDCDDGYYDDCDYDDDDNGEGDESSTSATASASAPGSSYTLSGGTIYDSGYGAHVGDAADIAPSALLSPSTIHSPLGVYASSAGHCPSDTRSDVLCQPSPAWWLGNTSAMSPCRLPPSPCDPPQASDWSGSRVAGAAAVLSGSRKVPAASAPATYASAISAPTAYDLATSAPATSTPAASAPATSALSSYARLPLYDDGFPHPHQSGQTRQLPYGGQQPAWPAHGGQSPQLAHGGQRPQHHRRAPSALPALWPAATAATAPVPVSATAPVPVSAPASAPAPAACASSGSRSHGRSLTVGTPSEFDRLFDYDDLSPNLLTELVGDAHNITQTFDAGLSSTWYPGDSDGLAAWLLPMPAVSANDAAELPTFPL